LVLLRQREAGLVRRYLSQYADAGWFTRAEVEMLSSMGQRRSARAWARGLGGRAAVRSMRAFQDSASDLALLRARIVRGSAEPGAGAHERDLLDAVTANRGGRRRPGQPPRALSAWVGALRSGYAVRPASEVRRGAGGARHIDWGAGPSAAPSAQLPP
jgi:hypothetical protein